MNNNLETEVLEILDFIDDYRSIMKDDGTNKDQKLAAYIRAGEYQDELEQLIRGNLYEIFNPGLGLRGFEIIDKSTNKPITERRYAELYNQVTGTYWSHSWKWNGTLKPSASHLYLNDEGNLVEMVWQANDYDSYDVKMIPARILDSDEVELRFK